MFVRSDVSLKLKSTIFMSHCMKCIHRMHRDDVIACTFCVSSPAVLDGVTLQNQWYFGGGLVDNCLFLGHVKLNLTTVVAVR